MDPILEASFWTGVAGITSVLSLGVGIVGLRQRLRKDAEGPRTSGPLAVKTNSVKAQAPASEGCAVTSKFYLYNVFVYFSLVVLHIFCVASFGYAGLFPEQLKPYTLLDDWRSQVAMAVFGCLLGVVVMIGIPLVATIVSLKKGLFHGIIINCRITLLFGLVSTLLNFSVYAPGDLSAYLAVVLGTLAAFSLFMGTVYWVEAL